MELRILVFFTQLVGKRSPFPPTYNKKINRQKMITYSLNSHRIRSNCSSLNRPTSATRRLNTCLPIQLIPTNFLDIRIGSQFNNLDKNARNVVPSVNGSKPDLNSLISRVAYASSSVVHLPRRSGC